MPRLARLYILQCAIGFGISAAFVALLLWLDVGRLWTMASHDKAGWLAIGLLWVFNGIVFAGVQFGIAIQRLGREDKPSGGRPVRIARPLAAPALVRVEARPHR